MYDQDMETVYIVTIEHSEDQRPVLDVDCGRIASVHDGPQALARRSWSEGHNAGRDYQGDGWNSDAHDPEDDNPYRA